MHKRSGFCVIWLTVTCAGGMVVSVLELAMWIVLAALAIGWLYIAADALWPRR